MNDYLIPEPEWMARERDKKGKLRAEKAGLQCAVAGLLALSVAVNMAQYGIIRGRDATIETKSKEIAQLKTMYDLALSGEHEAVENYDELLMQVEQAHAAREAQTASYESLSGYQYAGSFIVTAYCPCEECCGRWADGITSTGIPAVPGIVAVDPEVIPIGSTVVIDGQKYLAADTGVTGHCVDVFMTDHEASVQHGVKTEEVWVVEP